MNSLSLYLLFGAQLSDSDPGFADSMSAELKFTDPMSVELSLATQCPPSQVSRPNVPEPNLADSMSAELKFTDPMSVELSLATQCPPSQASRPNVPEPNLADSMSAELKFTDPMSVELSLANQCISRISPTKCMPGQITAVARRFLYPWTGSVLRSNSIIGYMRGIYSMRGGLESEIG
ncbi:hypothetical protein ACP275_13G040300 [Erythranthe tilingii]